MNLIQRLELTFPCILTAVGGGGKTSLLFALAREAAGQNLSVLITTTTAMFNPERFNRQGNPNQGFDRLVIGPPGKLISHPPKPGEILIGAPQLAAQGQKITGYAPQSLAPVFSAPAADLILIEGDGARMKPVKAPAAHEPVIPFQTGIVAGCIGMDCLGSPLNSQHVHRPEHLAAVTGQIPDSPISTRTLARLTCHPQGLFKGTPARAKKLVVLNKADTPEMKNKAIEVIDTIHHDIIDGGVPDMAMVTCLADGTEPVRFIKI